jgi:hypothetical protein
LIKLGWIADAEEVLQDIVTVMERNPSEEYAVKYHWLSSLAEIHMKDGDYSSAEDLYRQSWVERKKRFGEKSERALRGAYDLAVLYRALGDDLKTEEILYSAVEIAQEMLPVENRVMIDLHECLADVLCVQEYYEEAAEQIAFCYEGAAARRHVDRGFYLDRLISLLKKAGDVQRAREYEALGR